MSALGADPAQLDSIAQLFSDLAGELDYRRMRLTAWIELDRFWRGNRANEFRHAWEHQFSPQMSTAVQFLRDHVKSLHDNANQQRIASGEQPKDYGGKGFMHRLFDDAKKDLSHAAHDVAHAVESGWKDVEHAGKEVWSDEVAGFHEVVSSKYFAEAIGGLQVISTAAGLIALIPGCQAAAGVALVAGGLVMAGHLAQMANEGHFRPGTFALDALGVAGAGLAKGGLAAARAATVEGKAAGLAGKDLADVVQAAKEPYEGLNWFKSGATVLAKGTTPATIVKQISENPLRTYAVGVQTANAFVTAEQAGQHADADLRAGHYGDALRDGGFGLAEGELRIGAYDHAADGTWLGEQATHFAQDSVRDHSALDGLQDTLAEIGED